MCGGHVGRGCSRWAPPACGGPRLLGAHPCAPLPCHAVGSPTTAGPVASPALASGAPPACVQVAALAAEPFSQQPVAGDDVDDAAWVPVGALRGLGAGLVPGCAALAEEAARRFDIPPAEALPARNAQQHAEAG